MLRAPLAWCLLSSALTAGCGVRAIVEDQRAMEDLAVITGTVRSSEWSGAPVVVALLDARHGEGMPFVMVDFEQIFAEEGTFRFIRMPGTYRLVAFEDTNRDLRLGPGERAAAWNGFRDLEIRAGGLHERNDITVSGSLGQVPELEMPSVERRHLFVGDVMPLDSDRFGAAVGRRGMTEPVHVMMEHGAGIFMLEAYDPARVPVVFVHGISGYPQEFRTIIEGLDTARLQPWVVQYPSGWDLTEVARTLNNALNELHAERGFGRLCLVAHSMGGVVMRRLLQMHAERRGTEASFVRLFVTIHSPLGGIDGAAAGVRMSPIVIPSWRGLVPDGEFMQTQYAVALPDETVYALFFGHDGHSSGDGVVPLTSQLRREALAEADVLFGSVATHTGVLADARALTALHGLLARCALDE